MPRNVFDLLSTKNIVEHVQITVGIQDILNQKIVEQQFIEYENLEGETLKREQSIHEYYPSSIITLGVTVNFNQ